MDEESLKKIFRAIHMAGNKDETGKDGMAHKKPISLDVFKKFIISTEGKDCFRQIMRRIRHIQQINKTEFDDSTYIPVTFEAMLHYLYE